MVHLAVCAHIRHVYTAYDQHLKVSDRQSARNYVRDQVLQKLKEWRGDEGTVTEETFREVIYIESDDGEDKPFKDDNRAKASQSGAYTGSGRETHNVGDDTASKAQVGTTSEWSSEVLLHTPRAAGPHMGPTPQASRSHVGNFPAGVQPTTDGSLPGHGLHGIQRASSNAPKPDLVFYDQVTGAQVDYGDPRYSFPSSLPVLRKDVTNSIQQPPKNRHPLQPAPQTYQPPAGQPPNPRNATHLWMPPPAPQASPTVYPGDYVRQGLAHRRQQHAFPYPDPSPLAGQNFYQSPFVHRQ